LSLMLPDLVLIISIIGAALFSILYAVSIRNARKIDKYAKLSDRRRKELITTVQNYEKPVDESASTANQSDVSEDAEKAHQNNKKKKHGSSSTHNDPQYSSQLRDFHRSVACLFAALACLVMVLYHVGVISELVFTTRVSDSKVINPWRYWFGLSAGAALAYAYLGFAFQHRSISVLLISVHGSLSSMLLGVAILQAVGSWPFWVFVAGSLLVTAISSFFIYWHHSKHVAGQNWVVASLTCVYMPLFGILMVLLFIASPYAYGWWGFTVAAVLDIVFDALFFAIPTILLLTTAYYRRRWALYPRALYADYGIEEYWLLEAHQDHLGVLQKIKINK